MAGGTVADLIVGRLKAAGVKRIFGVVGDSFNGLRREDQVANLIRVGPKDWSFGISEAPLA